MIDPGNRRPKREWHKPETRRLEAGAAELLTGPISDNVDFS
jgi:hypothetical protein